MGGTHVGVLEQANHVGFSSLLKCQECVGLEPDARHLVHGQVPNKSLEGQASDQQIGALLVLADLPESCCPRSQPLLDLEHSLLESGRLARRLLAECSDSGRLGGKALGLLLAGHLGPCHVDFNYC